MSSKKDTEKKKRTYEGMNSAYFAKKWKSAFAGGMPADAVREYVDAPGCFL